MTDRRFSIPLILMALVALGLGVFAFPAEGIVLAIITIIISVKFREKYLIKIPILLCIVTVVVAGAFIAFMIYTCTKGGYNSYWLMRFIFDKS